MRDNYEGVVTVESSVMWENNPFESCTRSQGRTPDPCLEEWLTSHTGAYGEGAAPLSLLYRSSVSENNDTDLFMFGAAGAGFHGYYPGWSLDRYPPTSFF